MTHSTPRTCTGSLGPTTRHIQRAGVPALVITGLCAALLLASCEKNGAGASPAGPTPVSPTPRLLQQGSFALAAPTDDFINFAVVRVTDSVAGLWQANVDWAIDTNTLWMWVADGVCTAEQFADPECPDGLTCQCRFAIRSETATPKPRVLAIPNVSGGTRTIVVANLGPREETVQYRVTLTPTSLVSAHTALPSGQAEIAASRTSTARKALRRRH
jgi:hypothetical protein